jgi:hypothetical protein
VLRYGATEFEDGFMRSELETRLLHLGPSEVLLSPDASKPTQTLVKSVLEEYVVVLFKGRYSAALNTGVDRMVVLSWSRLSPPNKRHTLLLLNFTWPKRPPRRARNRVCIGMGQLRLALANDNRRRRHAGLCSGAASSRRVSHLPGFFFLF